MTTQKELGDKTKVFFDSCQKLLDCKKNIYTLFTTTKERNENENK